MKNISTHVYESLTNRQRIIATVEAEARHDAEEVQRLVKTCPKKSYLMTDADFSEGMQSLLIRSMAFECDIADMAIHYLFLSWLKKGDPESLLASMSVVEAAWHEELEDMGIDLAAMAKIGRPRSEVVSFLLDQAPPPDPAKVKALRDKLAKIEHKSDVATSKLMIDNA